MKTKKAVSKFFSLENLGILLVVFSIVGLICLIGGDLFFGQLGLNIRGVLLGVFGLTSYAFFFLFSVFGVLIVAGLKIKLKFSLSKFLLTFITVFSLFSIIHLASASYNGEYSDYVSKCYKMGFDKRSSFGGAFMALSVGLFASILSSIGAYVLFSLIFVAVIVYIVTKIVKRKDFAFSRKSDNKQEVSLPFFNNATVPTEEQKDVYDLPLAKSYKPYVEEKKADKDIVSLLQDSLRKKSNKSVKEETFNTGYNYSNNVSEPISLNENYKSFSSDEDLENNRITPETFIPKTESEQEEKNYFGNKNVNFNPYGASDFSNSEQEENKTYSDVYSRLSLKKRSNDEKDGEESYKKDFSKYVFDKKEDFSTEIEKRDYDGKGNLNQNSYSDKNLYSQKSYSDINDNSFVQKDGFSFAEQNSAGKFYDLPKQDVTKDYFSSQNSDEKDYFVSSQNEDKRDYFGAIKNAEKKEEISLENYDYSDFVFNSFPTTMLNHYNVNENKEQLEQFFAFCKERILAVIETMKKRSMEIAEIHHGPTLTRFDLPVPIGVAIRDITGLQEDMGVQLNCAGQLRIAPVPKSNKVGVEVPNENRVTVSLRELIESKEFCSAKAENVPFVVGKDVIGNVLVMELAKLTHILIAGCSGSGKSVFVRSILVSMMQKCSPKDMRLIICDPKGVDFVAFKGVPHLLIDEIIVDRPKIIKILDWAVKEMGRRYSKLQEAGCANIAEYNKIMKDREEMPRIVLFIDEFADLVSADKLNILPKVQILAQKARAAGIHVILAMQRPSVEIISGDIKVNFSTRISLKMQTAVDSRTILDETGAENLLNHGDMLFFTPNDSHLVRAQGPNVSGEEIFKVVQFLKTNNKCVFDEKIKAYLDKTSSSDTVLTGETDDDDKDFELKKKALEFVIRTQSTSVCALQRELRVGFNRASVLKDWMVKNGYVGNSLENNKSEVKITMEDYDKMFGEQK